MQWKAKTASDGLIWYTLVIGNNLVTDDIIWYTFDNILCTTDLPKSICQRTIELEIEDFTKPSEMNSIMN